MKVIDKIRKYINVQKAAGVILPGDKLPPYRELTAMFSGSIQTVRSALIKLETEGLVESVNGVGCFVNGKHPLNIAVIGLPATTISSDDLQHLLDKYVKLHKLHIDLTVLDTDADTVDPERLKSYPVILDFGTRNFSRSLLEFNHFDDYAKLASELQEFPYDISPSAMPFFYFTHHCGVHRETLTRIGMTADDLTSDFIWWNEYVKRCREHQIIPASIYWPQHGNTVSKKYGMFRVLNNLFFSLKINIDSSSDDISNIFRLPMFDSAAGEKLLQIINSCPFSETNATPFFVKHEGMDFKIGSWVNIPNSKRDEELIEKIDIISFKYKGKRIHTVAPRQLRFHLMSTVNQDEKRRLWDLTKIMLTADFQTEFCNLTGALSIRKQFAPENYFWSENRNMREVFIPAADDIMLYEHVFSLPYTTLLTTMIELYKQGELSATTTLTAIDKKFIL